MKAGARAVGVAESYRNTRREASSPDGPGESTLAAAVVRADRVVDGFAFATCTVGGTDATVAVVELLEALDREDLRYVFVSGIAPAWYNVLDLGTIHESCGIPVVSVSFEASDGLDTALRRAFDGEARSTRLETYRRQPDRAPQEVNGERVFVRSVGVDDPGRVVPAFTPEGGRPEPLRVARLAARAADRWRTVT